MNVTHGFQDTVTALPGRGDELVEFFFNAAVGAGPGTADDCVLFLVDRSERDPDTVFVTEGWTSKEAHERFFASDEAKAVRGGVQPRALTLHHHSVRLHVVAGSREGRVTVDQIASAAGASLPRRWV